MPATHPQGNPAAPSPSPAPAPIQIHGPASIHIHGPVSIHIHGLVSLHAPAPALLPSAVVPPDPEEKARLAHIEIMSESICF
jgi:hypothetical protein